MMALLKDMEILLFPVYQDSHWTLFEVSRAEEMIRHYATLCYNLIRFTSSLLSPCILLQMFIMKTLKVECLVSLSAAI